MNVQRFQMRLGRELTEGDPQGPQLAGQEGHDPADEITGTELVQASRVSGPGGQDLQDLRGERSRRRQLAAASVAARWTVTRTRCATRTDS